MAVYTISPCLLRIEEDSAFYFRCILFSFVNGSHKVAIDSNSEVLSIYSGIHKNQDIIQFWMKLMSNHPSRFEKIHVTFKDVDREIDKFLLLCSKTKGPHRMIVDSIQEVSCEVDIENCVTVYDEKVRLINKDDAIKELDQKVVIKEVIEKYPIRIGIKPNSDGAQHLIIEICNHFKHLIENNRMYNLLYNDDGSFKDESSVQELFFVLAAAYCKCYDVDLNRESDTGIGLLDFKFSVGFSCKVILEVKLASNSQLFHGEEIQLPAYMSAEETTYGVYMVVKTTLQDDDRCEKLLARIKDEKKHYNPVIIVDARKRPSASRL